MQKFHWGLMIACLVCWCSMPLHAQVAPSSSQTTGKGQLDQELAKCLAIDNRAVVDIAEFARQKAERSDVKEFAQQMTKEHKAFLDRLTQIRPSTGHQVTSQPGVVGQQPVGGAQYGSKMLAIKQEVADECVKALKKELGEKSGEEFDRCFMAQQISQHMHMLATLQVFERHAGSNLASVISDGTEKVESHLSEAKKIMKGVERDLAQAENRGTQSR